jgi:dipeptidyl aminopeptidase/acylaminoacyl peptidase
MNSTMHTISTRTVILLFILAAAIGFSPADVSETTKSTPGSPQIRGEWPPRIEGYYKGRITLHWFADNTRFWYRNDLSDETKEFIVVDTASGTRKTAFDHEKLAAALSEATGTIYESDRLPFETIAFGRDRVLFVLDETTWACDLSSYACTKTDIPPEDVAGSDDEGRPRFRGPQGPRRSNQPVDSPDGLWVAFVRDHNVFVRVQEAEDGEAFALSTDGVEGNAYGIVSWSPDSKTIVAFRVEPGDKKEVYRIESSPEGGGRAILHAQPYDLPGDKLPRYELNLFDAATHKQMKPRVDCFEHGWERPELHWNPDGSHFSYQQVDRGHQRFRVIDVDVRNGKIRNLVDEHSDTFIWTAHTENLRLSLVNWLERTDELIYVSEMDGWRHLYLVDTVDGTMRQITKGQFVIRGIDFIDEAARRIWFHAGGMNTDQDPYFVHYYRIDFDGSNLVALTGGNGNHSVQYSPDRKYIIDTYSRVDMPPVHELRRTSDGSLVCELEKADISGLIADGWTAPEVFVAKGRDGETNIWGIICRPGDFDPDKKYPVIEQIYAGPQSAYVPKSFRPMPLFKSLTDLGFIVVQIDGMGTAFRSKAFHDVCWHNLRDAGFPDRILWHKEAADKYPHYDISRVGIYGVSAGGQNAAGAVLFHPEFYKAAVAASGCHDNRMDKASWNEQWMGYPVGPQYAENSNIDNAHRLGGKLLLIVGEMDDNVPPESTIRFVDALIKAEKDFDFLFVPGAAHGMGGSYGERRMRDFFAYHLLGIEPPDRNTAVAEPTGD